MCHFNMHQYGYRLKFLERQERKNILITVLGQFISFIGQTSTQIGIGHFVSRLMDHLYGGGGQLFYPTLLT